MNPMMMLKTLINGKKDPQSIISSMVNGNSNPMLQNVLNMAKKGDKQGVEDFARNLFKEQGRDFDKEYQDFINSMK